jgi:hypothetical protein
MISTSDLQVIIPVVFFIGFFCFFCGLLGEFKSHREYCDCAVCRKWRSKQLEKSKRIALRAEKKEERV